MNILKSKIKNTFMSIKDLYKKWTSLSDHGYKMINEIINIKLRKEYGILSTNSLDIIIFNLSIFFKIYRE